MVLVNQFFGAPADLFKSTNFKVSNIVLLPLFCVFLTLDKLKDGETKNSSFVYGEFFPSVVDSSRQGIPSGTCSQALNAVACGCRRPRCNQRHPLVLERASCTPCDELVPFSMSRRNSPWLSCPKLPQHGSCCR